MAQSFNVLKELGALNIANGGTLRVGDHNDGVAMSFDGTSTTTIDAATANDEISFGAGTATDVRLNGATAGADILWDASADQMIVTDNASVRVGDAADGFVLQFDGTNTLNVDPANANDILRVGETTQADVQFDGATDIVWDASVGSLVNGGMFVPVIPNAAIDTNSTDASSISVTSPTTLLSTAGAETRTLPDGTVAGQLKNLVMSVDNGDCVVTVTTAAATDADLLTFNEVGQFITLMWTGAAWRVVNEGAGDTTVMSLPTIA